MAAFWVGFPLRFHLRRSYNRFTEPAGTASRLSCCQEKGDWRSHFLKGLNQSSGAGYSGVPKRRWREVWADIKNYITLGKTEKFRYVAQGYADSLKPFLSRYVASLRPTSIKLLQSLAYTFRLRLFFHDLSQAYQMACKDLTQQIYLLRTPEDRHLFDTEKGTLLKLIKPIYAPCDSEN